MATQQGWDDFKALVDYWKGSLTQIASLKNTLDSLIVKKAEVISDAPRKEGMTPIGNQYPGFNMNSICTDVDRVIALKAILVANGF